MDLFGDQGRNRTTDTANFQSDAPPTELRSRIIASAAGASLSKLKHDLVSAEEWQRPWRVVESKNGFADRLEFMLRGILAKLVGLHVDQGVDGEAEKLMATMCFAGIDFNLTRLSLEAGNVQPMGMMKRTVQALPSLVG